MDFEAVKKFWLEEYEPGPDVFYLNKSQWDRMIKDRPSFQERPFGWDDLKKIYGLES